MATQRPALLLNPGWLSAPPTQPVDGLFGIESAQERYRKGAVSSIEYATDRRMGTLELLMYVARFFYSGSAGVPPPKMPERLSPPWLLERLKSGEGIKLKVRLTRLEAKLNELQPVIDAYRSMALPFYRHILREPEELEALSYKTRNAMRILGIADQTGFPIPADPPEGGPRDTSRESKSKLGPQIEMLYTMSEKQSSQVGALLTVSTDIYRYYLKKVGRRALTIEDEQAIRYLKLEEKLGLLREKDGTLAVRPEGGAPERPERWDLGTRKQREYWGEEDQRKLKLFKAYDTRWD